MSANRALRLSLAALFIPLSFLFYNFVYFLISALSEIRVFHLAIPTVVAYLGLFSAFYLVLLIVRGKTKKTPALLLSASVVLLAAGLVGLVIFASYFGSGLLNDIAPHGIGYPFDGLLVSLFDAVAGAIVFSFRGKIAASSTLESEDRKDRLFAFNVVYGVAYTFLTLYFLAGAFYMASYSRIDPSTAFPLIVVFLSIVSLYASMFIVVPKWNKKAANIVFASHLGANLLLTILTIVSFVLFPNALADGYPALVPLELMGSLFVLPYALPVLLLLNSCLFYFLVCRKDKPAKGEKEER